MALTNAMLKAMGIEQDQRDQIMAAHQDVLESIKAERDELRDTAARVPHLEKEVEDLKAAQPVEDWEAKYNELKAEYDSYKDEVAREKADQEKAQLYRSLLREQGVDESRISAIMKVTDLGSIAVKDGAIADAEALKEAIVDEWGAFIPKSEVQGAKVEEPPASAAVKMTRDEIMSIQDTRARQKAIAENIDQFR